jgi:hypothetical protein
MQSSQFEKCIQTPLKEEISSSEIKRENGKKQLDNKKKFPSQIYVMLEETEMNNQENIVSWMSHGRAFRVHKPKEFVKEVMPLYFKQTKWPSFQRQLHLYEFIRITHGPDKGACYHEMFLRGYSSLLPLIKRVKIKGTKVRVPAKNQYFPNFHSMPPLSIPTVPSKVISVPVEEKVDQVDGNTIATQRSSLVPLKKLAETRRSSSIRRGSLVTLLTGDFLDLSDEIEDLDGMFAAEEELFADISRDFSSGNDSEWHQLMESIIDYQPIERNSCIARSA